MRHFFPLRILIGGRRLRPLALVSLTLGISGIFKAAAFWREAYIASRFGVSADTDVYFGFQQLPLALVTFILGAFGLAFTPAYAKARKTAEAALWTAGILTIAIGIGLLGSVATLAAEPFLVRSIHAQSSATEHLTLLFLSLSYAPILITGIWVCVSNAAGRTLQSLTITGLPYLLMTLTLVALCSWPGVQQVSLPASLLAGFFITGAGAVWSITTHEPFSFKLSSVLAFLRLASFHRFLRQLGSSVLENAGYIGNQMLMMFCFGLTGPGGISANNYAMRIGMLGYGILTLPLAQLTQARFCKADEPGERRRLFVHQMITMTILVGGAAFVLCMFRSEIARLVYLRGRFSPVELASVVALLPAWFSYFTVISLNAVTSRMLFVEQRGMRYARTMLGGYALSNVLRIVAVQYGMPAGIIWGSVIGEGLAFLWNMKSCFEGRQQETSEPVAGVATAVAA